MNAPRVEINGDAASVEQLARFATLNYGHFTTLQVDQRRVRGLSLHLQRLDAGSRELFACPLPAERVRDLLRHALRDVDGAASVRINVFSLSFDRDRPEREAPLDLMISVGPPPSSDARPVRVCTQVYERELPQVKHFATFGLMYQRRLARLAGYDDALFVDRQGRISEGSVWNLGLWDGEGVTWPQAPMLDGVSMRLLQAGLIEVGIRSERRELRCSDLPAFRSAFLCNANRVGVPIIAINDLKFAEDRALGALLAQCYARVPAETI